MVKKNTFTTYDIAKYCGVSPRTAAQWVNEGKIKAYRTPGNHSRVKLTDFLDFLKNYNIPVPDKLRPDLARGQIKKILIVDDDRNMVCAIERILKRRDNFKIEKAFDGFDAGKKLVFFNPHLVILDIRMPGLDGFSVAEKIKEDERFSDVKIIVLSAFFESDGKKKMRNIGVDLCMEKPFDKDHLVKRIEDLLL